VADRRLGSKAFFCLYFRARGMLASKMLRGRRIAGSMPKGGNGLQSRYDGLGGEIAP
jgi:hypothetical protein